MKNKNIPNGDNCLIRLHCGLFVKVSACDFERVRNFKWHIRKMNNGRLCVIRIVKDGERKRQVFLHRFILSAPEGVLVDHRNHDGLDNRRENIRLCTHSQNSRNRKDIRSSSGFFGVYRIVTQAGNIRWRTEISVNNRNMFIGNFDSAIEAAKAYDLRAIEIAGDFARLNFPTRSRRPNHEAPPER